MSNQERVAERRKHWGELVARQQQSGKTVKAFCQENGVGGSSFYVMAEAAEGEDPASGLCLGGDRRGGPAARSGDGVDLVLRRAPSDRLAGTTTGTVIERVGCATQKWNPFCRSPGDTRREPRFSGASMNATVVACPPYARKFAIFFYVARPQAGTWTPSRV